jgi:hypothetical protein
MQEIWPLTTKEYADLMGLTISGVNQQIREKRLPESVRAIKHKGDYILLTKLDEGTCKCIRFIGGNKWYTNGCKIHSNN